MSRPSSNADPLRPDDFVDAESAKRPAPAPKNPELGFMGWVRFVWRQLTSMRTAIVLLIMLAMAAIPGSLVPQESSDPNGVIQVREENPGLLWFYDAFQLHHVFESYWFSAIYLLLFISLIGCILPRTKHHLKALRTPPPKIPARLSRLKGYTVVPGDADDVDRAQKTLKKLGYRTRLYEGGVSAERGYLRETGNLVFHVAMLVLLVAVAVGGSLGYKGQRLVFEGYSYANTLSSWDLFQPGRFFSADSLPDFSLTLNELDVVYEMENKEAFGQPTDFTGYVTVTDEDGSHDEIIKVNQPLNVQGADLFLLSNGYAPVVTVRDDAGEVVFQEPVPFLSQDEMNTSLGVIKLPDGLDEQVGMRGFFYPSAVPLDTGAYASGYPDLWNPLMTMQVYTGDLGLDDGAPSNVYVLDTDGMTQVAGGDSDTASLELAIGETAELPDGLGTISLDEVVRYAVIDIQSDPMNKTVLVTAIVLITGLITALLVPRRRVWVKVTPKGLEVAGLARGEDPTLEKAVEDVADRLREGSADQADAPDSPKDDS
ncbi:cytochrome c biogenesis protein ResB [Agrococcus casei]|uniref:Ccs1/ResB-related putative cytochrome C-type biogenesis protein n=3 Tax=Agrococcus TaxID=46352 RepID=A0A1R4G9K0_9MICO|nr:cytochrome c biogenesis protein ResB [Agrococcus casei]SJM64864.1 Ccs1/ResB-related putative cytochrome C-type biogenesis protein [Agrococcus casei LMG 22410]